MLPRSPVGLLCRICPPASRCAPYAFIPASMWSARTLNTTSSLFLSPSASSASSASRSASGAFIPASMGSSMTPHNTPSLFLSPSASSASSASRCLHPGLHGVFYDATQHPLAVT
ncbi:hypothetical protein C8F04DRAFT_1252269 [Mycena alexandri]|uniref:Uncharacterized protein n=1 Tax=Mycena alexandri TaxID=1745969 RepID=A0AAD6TA75_9AGAR|nr:hypothetical protein C8F04DRAFT_1252269 [Mycena alexandri]